MIGAITGDIVGSVYEFDNHRDKRFPLFREDAFFTDDTVLSVALAETLMHGGDYGEAMRRWYRRYPDASYGGMFRQWARTDDAGPYYSWGNGSAMRVSPIGYAFDDLESVLDKAAASAAPTHDHPEGIKGAQAVAAAILWARQGQDKDTIRRECETRFGYDLAPSLADIRADYDFDVSCQGTVPPAITAFLEAEDFEDAIRNAISLGGDSDTLACITGGIAEAFYGVPPEIEAEAFKRLDPPLADVVAAFRQRVMTEAR
ncbi:ADP-ribosylglycohydrolase family protein [Salinisphaera hydrothermalis]|uniref:ADP-ribosylation/Crystallin J1 n=1 Tax=Salinisphaera hydrothermalis (strain C41B8) TaxID=1304275 RepID=A0A084IIR4_SALHC|nr:ADP-ribosylglycohydrolase family protein [Salinisphaera hydrothermalis]KEZ76598.1 ADP-ribosylation/Crystallin J1 [Salinisphaera hydrothermalis C41B8]